MRLPLPARSTNSGSLGSFGARLAVRRPVISLEINDHFRFLSQVFRQCRLVSQPPLVECIVDLLASARDE